MILIVDFIEVSIGKFSYENIRLFDSNLGQYSKFKLDFITYYIKEYGYYDTPLDELLTKFKVFIDINYSLHDAIHDDWISDFVSWYKENYTVEENILRIYSDN